MTDGEYVESLERQIKTLEQEVDDLNDELAKRIEREKDAFMEGYNKALELARDSITEIAYEGIKGLK